MLTEKQFRERTRSELRQIGERVKAIATDRAVYLKLESDILGRNPDLRNTRSVFLDMVRGCYTDAMTARMLRLLEPREDEASLGRILGQLAGYPGMLHDRTSETELVRDRAALEQAAANLGALPISGAAHHERTPSALAPTHRELNAAIDLMLSTVKTYYWIIAGSYIDLEPSLDESSFAHFQLAWSVPALAK